MILLRILSEESEHYLDWIEVLVLLWSGFQSDIDVSDWNREGEKSGRFAILWSLCDYQLTWTVWNINQYCLICDDAYAYDYQNIAWFGYK